MIKKLTRLVLLALILWLGASVLYFLAVQQDVEAELTPAFGSDYAISVEYFDDWYLQNNKRSARVIVAATSGPAKEASTIVTVSGRWLPKTVNINNLEPLRFVVGDRVDQVGRETAAQRSRHGLDESVIED